MADVAAALIRQGVLSPDAASRALAAARDGDVASAALRLGLADENTLVRALAKAHGCPGVDLSRSVVPLKNLEVVAADFCRERKILPVSVGRSEVVLAMIDPEDYAAADEVRYTTGRKVLRYVSVGAAITRVLDGLSQARASGSPGWRGEYAPSLPDPAAAWVGVVKPTETGMPAGRAASVELPAAEEEEEMVLVGIAESLMDMHGAPSPAAAEAKPARPAPAALGREDPTVRVEGLGVGKLVLVADDDAETRQLIARILEGLGCTVLHAANGRAALDVVRQARPDMLVLDAMMPVLHGFEVCRAVKGDPVLRKIRVVLCSAVYRGTVGEDAKTAFGADAFLEKPFRLEEANRVFRVALVGTAAAESADERARREAAATDWRAGAKAVSEGRLDEAVELCRRAAETDPFSAEAHYYLGHALSRQGMLFEAVAAFERATELRPDADSAHQCLAQILERLGFQRSARQAWAQAVETCKDAGRKKAMQARLLRLLAL